MLSLAIILMYTLTNMYKVISVDLLNPQDSSSEEFQAFYCYNTWQTKEKLLFKHGSLPGILDTGMLEVTHQ